MDFDDFLDLLFPIGIGLVILTVIVSIITVSFAPKNVDYYYLSKGSSDNGVSCAYAHWTWHPDEKAFCSNNADEVVAFASKANAMLKAR